MPDSSILVEITALDLLPELARLCSARDPESACECAAALLARLLGAARARVFLLDPGSDTPRLAASAPEGKTDVSPAILELVRRLTAAAPNPVEDLPGQEAVGVPLQSGQRILGAVLVEGPFLHPNGAGMPGSMQAIAQILASVLNLWDLYTLVGDQAGRLEVLQAGHVLETSLSRSILEAIADGVLVTNAAHQVAVLNTAAESILRLDRQAVVGRPAVGVVGVFGPVAPEWASAVQKWSSAPTSQYVEPISQQLRLEDGRMVALRVAPIRQDGEFLGTLTIFRDVTQDVEVNRLKSEFVATVSHELRTPMTSIRGNTEILLMGAVGALNEEQRHHLQVIRNNADRLGLLVNDLLDVSRIETGRVRLSLQPIDLPSALDQAREYGETLAQERGKPVSVVVQADPDLPAARADPARLRQVLENLIQNAFNFTPAGGRICLRAAQAESNLEIAVEDSGIGIPPAELPRVFDRFFRGEQSLTLGIPGTGLGLSIVQHLVALHGGSIRVESPVSDGRGTRVSFTLPSVPSG
jgi:signal transduction histidine kinase